MKYTDTQMLDWVLSRGWVARVRRKRVKPFENDAFILCMRTRKNIERAMADRVDMGSAFAKKPKRGGRKGA